jgi:HPt (histidine-containing phosphotransfer) domain-containing protein
MSHPALGLPPSDATAGHPEVAARLRAADRLAVMALDAAYRIDGSLPERYDELMQRRLLRDYDRHIEQLARAIETGEDHFVVMYGETLVPAYRRRHVRMNDVVSLLQGLAEAAVAIGPSADAEIIRAPMDAWVERMRHHRRLPGDHEGNAAVRFVWKGAGFGDDTVV